MTQTARSPLSRRLPPDESLWQRYSSHHEFQVSASTSAIVHAIVFALLLLGLGAFALHLTPPKEIPEGVGTVEVVPGEPGSGGDDAGPHVGPGLGPRRGEAVAEEGPPRPGAPQGRIEPQLKPPPSPGTKVEDDPRGERIRVGQDARPIQALERIRKSVRDKLMQNLRGGDGKPGRPGAGRGGKPDPRTLEERRWDCLNRWTMIFNTTSGQDYRAQLSYLGAFVAVPLADDKYLVVRQLQGARPVEGKIEPLQKVERIFWIDDKPESVVSLARALGLKEVPAHLVAFFPLEFEEKLLDLELKYGGADESDIQATTFEIRRRPGGGYEPVVVAQRLKPR